MGACLRARVRACVCVWEREAHIRTFDTRSINLHLLTLFTRTRVVGSGITFVPLQSLSCSTSICCHFRLRDISLCALHALIGTHTHIHTHLTYLIHEPLVECSDLSLIIQIFANLNFLIIIGVVVCMYIVPVNPISFSALWQHQPIIGNRPVGSHTGSIFVVKLDTVCFVKMKGRG